MEDRTVPQSVAYELCGLLGLSHAAFNCFSGVVRAGDDFCQTSLQQWYERRGVLCGVNSPAVPSSFGRLVGKRSVTILIDDFLSNCFDSDILKG